MWSKPKNMKTRNKGKIYPSSSSSSSAPSSFPAGDSLSVLKLLPAAILGLAVVLSLEDREVLAYMIRRSINSTNPCSSSVDNKKKTSNTHNHKPPLFGCDCFDCYTSYWFKWDSSPNRELIHQAIEAFEESLSNGEQSKKKGKKREKTSHRHLVGKTYSPPPELQGIQVLPEYEVASVEEKAEGGAEDQNGILNDAEEIADAEAQLPEAAVVASAATASQHKGLTRKVLPDVIGLFNWRLWSLWSPNV